MGTQPIFRTRRLILRPRRAADIPACLAMDRTAGVLDYIRLPPMDEDSHRRFIDSRTRGPWPEGMGYWSVFGTFDPTTFLGWVLLIPEDAQGSEIEIGWRLRPDAWGQGIATEAASALLAHAFGTLALARVSAVIHADNLASQRVAAKIGMRLSHSSEQDGRIGHHFLLTCQLFVQMQDDPSPAV